jgi:23S rRNA (uracil1939-C5)-methyltransferase
MSRHRRKPIPEVPVELTITGLTHDGRGISRLGDKIHFVFGALPGETVSAKYTRCFSRYDEVLTLEVLANPSPDRGPVPCPHFGLCGGCQMQQIRPEAQVKHKQALFEEQLTQAKILPELWLPPLVGDYTGYRQKARLAVRYVTKKGMVLIGFREQKNNKIAIIDSCQTLDPRVGLQIKALRDCVESLESKETIAQIEVAIGGEEVALVFRHMQPLSTADVNILREFCKAQAFSLYLQPDSAQSVHKVWPTGTPLELTYTLVDQGLSFQFHPLDFIQVNQPMNQKMINQALEWLAVECDDTVLDLFCGLGNFSLALAQKAKAVVGVEGSEGMVARAQQNATRNNLSNVEFYAADLSVPLINAGWAQKQYSKILLDPSRLGAQALVENIEHFGAKDILYVSCNPATFTRDAAILIEKGYRLTKVGVMDMFPHTAHLEVMGLFKR